MSAPIDNVDRIQEINTRAQEIMDSLTRENLIAWLEQNSFRRYPVFGWLADNNVRVVEPSLGLVAIDVDPDDRLLGTGYPNVPEWIYQFHIRTRNASKQEALTVAREV